MKVMVFILLLIVPLVAQNKWTENEDVLSSNGNYYSVSDADSVFFNLDTLWVCGAETLTLYLNTGKTLGQINLWGIGVNRSLVTGSDGDTLARHAAEDSGIVYIEGAIHKGSGKAVHTGMTETFYTLDSMIVDSNGTDQFYARPLANSNLAHKTLFYVVHFRGLAGKIIGIWFREERIAAY